VFLTRHDIRPPAAPACAVAGNTVNVHSENVAAGRRQTVRRLALSEGGQEPVFSHLLSGGTNLYGYQLGFSVMVEATFETLVLDIVFDPTAAAGPVPEDARFELEPSGRVRISNIPPAARKTLVGEVERRSATCPGQ
jgi:hypothetical protein